jgi:hypothetical protein
VGDSCYKLKLCEFIVENNVNLDIILTHFKGEKCPNATNSHQKIEHFHCALVSFQLAMRVRRGVDETTEVLSTFPQYDAGSSPCAFYFPCHIQ